MLFLISLSLTYNFIVSTSDERNTLPKIDVPNVLETLLKKFTRGDELYCESYELNTILMNIFSQVLTLVAT